MLAESSAATTSIEGTPQRHVRDPPSSARCSTGATRTTIASSTSTFATTNGILVHHHPVVPGSALGICPMRYATAATSTAAVMCQRYTDIATEFAAIVACQARADRSSHLVIDGASAAAVNE